MFFAYQIRECLLIQRLIEERQCVVNCGSPLSDEEEKIRDSDSDNELSNRRSQPPMFELSNGRSPPEDINEKSDMRRYFEDCANGLAHDTARGRPDNCYFDEDGFEEFEDRVNPEAVKYDKRRRDARRNASNRDAVSSSTFNDTPVNR
jgi:hypothetical protein